ncbi:pilus assembly protein PilM, partial [bacterium]|nr:pilus assembly protein PilM [bacterium]
GFRLTKHLTTPLFSSGDTYDPEGPKKSVVVPRLADTFNQLGIAPRRVKFLASAIGGQAVAAKEIKTIQMTDEEMDSSLLLEARKHLPLDGSESIVDYQIIGDDPTEPGKIRVLLVSATRKVFQSHVEMLRDVELRPGIVDIDQLAAINAYVTQNDLPDDGVIVSLHVGCKKTTLSCMGRRSFFFTRDVPIAGFAFTQELMTKYGLTYQQAEEVKMRQGLKPDLPLINAGDEAGLKLADKGILDKLSDEINRSLRYYIKESGESYFNNFLVTGGSAAMPGLIKHLEEKFNLPVTTYNPIQSFDSGNLDIQNGPQLAVAVGLALRAE